MWGYKSIHNKQVSHIVFKKIVFKKFASIYNQNLKNAKGADQNFLRDQVYSLLKSDSLIHDSYLCDYYANTSPFPTKRIGSCFVGAADDFGDCSIASAEQLSNYICPIKCRYNLNWKFC